MNPEKGKDCYRAGPGIIYFSQYLLSLASFLPPPAKSNMPEARVMIENSLLYLC
jgi:hypothetical protein